MTRTYVLKWRSMTFFCVILLALIVYFPPSVSAKVSGICVNCHTMHNSQDGAPMAYANGLWDGGAWSGDIDAEPNGGLLRADCIGCHSATSGLTVTVGSSTIPIVRTTSDPAGTYLAGGNFYYTDTVSDANGHNVTNPDDTLDYGPGLPLDFAGLDPAIPGSTGHCAGSCHNKLFEPIRSGNTLTGCQGCHLTTFHHGDPGPYNATSTETDPTYRYLTGHHYFPSSHSDGNGYVEGVEDDDWEADSSGHNYYKGVNQASFANATDAEHEARVAHTLASFCSNCHLNFHNEEGTGDSSPWLRHPVDQSLPGTGEFAGYTYSTETPVAYSTLPSTPAGGDEAGPIVTCVSCHRTHASQYSDMLRFDYSTMLAGMGGSGGCFNCHSGKN